MMLTAAVIADTKRDVVRAAAVARQKPEVGDWKRVLRVRHLEPITYVKGGRAWRAEWPVEVIE